MRSVTENVTERETNVCNLLGTVRENHWESYHTSTTAGRNVVFPTRQVTDHLVLWSRPQTFNLVDAEGQPASIFIQKGRAYHTEYTLEV